MGTTLTNKNSIQEEIKSRFCHGMLAVIRCRIFCLLVCYPKIQRYIHINTILPVVLYGCETWSLTLSEERRLRVFENGVLRRIFGPEREEVTGEWRKLNIEELIDLYCSSNIVRVIKSRLDGRGM